jgi:hypothetical protein
MAGRGLLRGARGGSRNVVTVRKRALPGATPGTSEEPGDRPSYGYLAPAGGALCGKARQLASRCGEAGRGPSISYMEGPYLIVPGRNILAGSLTAPRQPPESAATAVRGYDRVQARPLTGYGTWRSTGSPCRFQLVTVVTQARQ